MPDSVTPRPYGVIPLEQARTMSGLEIFGGMREGRFPPPPIMRFLNGDLAEVEFGRVVFRGAPTEDHYNPLGGAVHTTLPAGRHYTTVEIKVNYVRAMTDGTGLVRAEGRVINVGSRIATAEGRLTDSAGKLLAHGTTTCLVFPA
jgi:acyl-coenzyme A thioesterase PaaI-like protein